MDNFARHYYHRNHHLHHISIHHLCNVCLNKWNAFHHILVAMLWLKKVFLKTNNLNVTFLIFALITQRKTLTMFFKNNNFTNWGIWQHKQTKVCNMTGAIDQNENSPKMSVNSSNYSHILWYATFFPIYKEYKTPVKIIH